MPVIKQCSAAGGRTNTRHVFKCPALCCILNQMNPFRIITHDLPELEHVAALGKRGVAYMVLVEKREGKRPLGNLGIVGMITLK